MTTKQLVRYKERLRYVTNFFVIVAFNISENRSRKMSFAFLFPLKYPFTDTKSKMLFAHAHTAQAEYILKNLIRRFILCQRGIT